MHKKIFILDTNLSLVYGENVNLDKMSKFLKSLTEEHHVIIVTNGWYEQGFQICELFQNNKIDIISGGGACIKLASNPNYEYADFISKIDADLILHLAINSYSGLFIKGSELDNSNSNVSLNYFLNFQDAKDFKGIWKLGFDLNNDYLSFERKMTKIKISEIYVFGNNSNFSAKFLDSSNNANDLIKQRNVNMTNFLKHNYLFNSKMCSKNNAVNKYLQKTGLKSEDIVYISLGEIDEAGLIQYGQVILPSDINASFKESATFVYDVKNPETIIDYINSKNFLKISS